MEAYFGPVWEFQRRLGPEVSRAVFFVRLVVAATAPFVFAYSWGLFNPLMENLTPVYMLVITLMTFFVMRGPRRGAGSEG
jgi:ribose/xylose/arabinose/galactoside ABC-type transport system permease subunit